MQKVETILATIVGALLLLTFSSDVHAKFCGDDIGGARVACACGDIVASHTILQPGDPVVDGRCEAHGLIVRADRTADSITLNLSGMAIVGSGRGIGIKIERGGSDGAVIVGGDPPRLGEVVGFGVGVTSMSSGALARLERVSAKGNAHAGFQVRQNGAVVQDLIAEKNGGDGIRIAGTGGRFLGLRADQNEDRGISVNSPGAIVNGSASYNGTHGVVVPSPRSRLESVEAHGNARTGVLARSKSQSLTGISSTNNGGTDVRVSTRGAQGARR